MKPRLTATLEIKAVGDREFEGHGSVFGNMDLGGDVVEKGAFAGTLARHRKSGKYPPMLWMHDPSRVAGKWLDMEEDSRGLLVRGRLAETPLGEELHTLLKMDAVSGMSIGYQTLDADYDEDGSRRLKELDLWELSLVSMPMNPLAQVAHVKSQLSAAGEYVPTAREFERVLREAGCSRRVAREIIHLLPEQKMELMDDQRDADDPQREAVEVPEGDDLKAAAELSDLFLAASLKL